MLGSDSAKTEESSIFQSNLCNATNDYDRAIQFYNEYALNNSVSNDEDATKPKRPGRKIMSTPDAKKTKRKCEACNKWLSDRSALRKHVLAVHLDLRKTKCDYCGKPFRNNQQKNVHMKRNICNKNI